MAAEVKKEIELEIAHVLFIDIIAYSKLSVDEQHARIEKLNEVVRGSEAAWRAIRPPGRPPRPEAEFQRLPELLPLPWSSRSF